jgi:hypothetical protein
MLSPDSNLNFVAPLAPRDQAADTLPQRLGGDLIRRCRENPPCIVWGESSLPTGIITPTQMMFLYGFTA